MKNLKGLKMQIHGNKRVEMKIKKLLKYFLVCIGVSLILSPTLYAAEVHASVSAEEVVKGTHVELKIEAIGGSAAFPDISMIDGVGVLNANISQQSYMSIRFNGIEKQTTTVRKYTFIPTKDMTVPAYTINISGKKYKTKPIHIKVVESHAPKVSSDKGYAFVMESNKKSLLVGESFVMTLYLTMDNRLGVQQVSDYSTPHAPNFFLKDLGKQKQYKKDNTTIIEKRYSVTAKKEGNFTITGAVAKLGVTDRTKQDLFGRYAIGWLNISSNSIDVSVIKSLEKTTDLVGDFTLSSKIDASKVKANKPVNLTVTIQGIGSLEDFEFPSYEIDGVTVYSDAAKMQSAFDNGDLVSKATKHYTFISDTPFMVPSRSISMLSTTTQVVSELQIPAYTIGIEDKKLTKSPEISAKNPEMLKDNTENKSKSKSMTDNVSLKSQAWWMLLIISFLFGMLFMYLVIILRRTKKTKRHKVPETDPLTILYAHISADKEVEDMVRRLYARKYGDKSIVIDKKKLKELLARYKEK